MLRLHLEHNMREVRGVILFRDSSLDPKTDPWCAVVRSFYFDDMLEQLAARDPDHPLTAVFQPVLESSEEALEQNASREGMKRPAKSKWS